MSLLKALETSGTAMNAQQIRLSIISSNLANAQTVSSTSEGAYKAKHPVFAAVMDNYSNENPNIGVKVKDVIESNEPIRKEFNPGHPMSDEEGCIYLTNINSVEEMANMMSASRSFQTNVQVANTSKSMLVKLLRLGK
jgi:flagellar basal-body rod protein FlgC